MSQRSEIRNSLKRLATLDRKFQKKLEELETFSETLQELADINPHPFWAEKAEELEGLLENFSEFVQPFGMGIDDGFGLEDLED